MGSSDSGTGVAVDCSVGTIVWVRRRNGSWWPGKVVGPDELSASHLMSPRSGTPVKLLGREDASVDWYNLEKSKRVKAFRCGEFDDCIERAEASLGIPPKKRDKYARREDAILHALELEKQMLEKKYGKLGSSSNGESSKLSDGMKKELATTSSEIMGSGNGKHVNPKSDDDNSDALPRMRGLQDFGLKIARSKRKVSSATASNGSQKLVSDDCAYVSPNGDQRRENMILANSRSSLDKRKRSDEGLFEEYLAKRRDRRRPLVQVMESSAKSQVPHPLYLTAKSGDCSEDTEIRHDQMEVSVSESEENKSPHPVAPGEKNISGSTEDTETDSSETDSVESDTDSDDTMDAFSDDDAPIEFIPKSLGRSEAQGEHGRMSSEEPDDVPLASGVSNFYHNTPDSASMGVSEWQMKGKRNNRGLAKRYLKVSESYGRDELDLIENNYRTQMAGYGSRGFDGVNRNIIDWDELAWNNQPTSRGGYWRDPPEYLDHGRRFGGRTKTTLIDVDLKVQSSYQREHVPMISLMSKLNGNAIVGHPIQVETLEDGLSETLIAAADDFGPEVSDYDTTLPPVWTTARRTASSRVPRPQIRKGLSHQPQMDRKFLRKPPKKMILSSSPKIRTLSSIATQQKHFSDYSKHVSNGYQLDGLIKPESGPTTVSCIPVKLVFSRLYEELVCRHQ